MLDLFAIARANGPAIQAAFESAVANLPESEAAAAREFAAWVEAEGLISVNMRLYVVVELLNGGRYQTMCEWAKEHARLGGQDAEDLLRRRLGPFYDRRVAFDRAFEDGEGFKYGSLNTGGAGTARYGSYCVILGRSFDGLPDRAAYLPGDSLTVCFGPEGRFDEAAVERHASPHSHRGRMVALRRAAAMFLTARQDWPKLVCSPDQYFEAIFIDEVTLQAIGCVRVPKSEYDRMWEMTFASFGEKRGDAERALMHDFLQLLRAGADGRIQLEVVA
jgi:hypothetical protein